MESQLNFSKLLPRRHPNHDNIQHSGSCTFARAVCQIKSSGRAAAAAAAQFNGGAVGRYTKKQCIFFFSITHESST